MFSFLVMFALLAAALGYNQLIRGPELSRQAVAMRSKKIALKEYPRGEILDRNLIPITSSRLSQAVYFLFTRETMQPQNMQKAAAELSNALGDLSRQQILAKLQEGQKNASPFVRVAMDLTFGQAARINLCTARGLVMAPISKRYGNDGFCAHLIGYISDRDSFRGHAGLEKVYNDILQKPGPEKELVTVLDARGTAIHGLMFKIRQEQTRDQGQLILTIDRRIQQIVENAVNDSMAQGAVIVMDIKTREILAMASRPTFNQNDIAPALRDEENSPLINRALNACHPGSLFKILLAAAALAENKVTPEEQFFCQGHIEINPQVTINCWKEEGHGQISFAGALANSCNPVFIAAGLKLGRSDLLKYAQELEITDTTIIGYPDNQLNSFITIDSGQAALANASIGQQGVMLTPLQLTSLLATIADDGWYKSPVLVKYTVDSQGSRKDLPQDERRRVLKTAAAREVQKMMVECVSQGTGKSAALSEIMVAGKTATSQTGMIKGGQEVLNTWFGGYLPIDKPRWAIVVLVEDGRSGAVEAAPIFKTIARNLLPLYSLAE